MNLEELWQKYASEDSFNVSCLPESLIKQGSRVEYQPNAIIVFRGEFPSTIYFILEGTVTGIREYPDGNVYTYFQLDKHNGSIGLLEIMAMQQHYIATIVALTKVTMIQIDASLVYQAIMEDVHLLRSCANLLSKDLYQRSGHDGVFYFLSGINRLRYYLTEYYQSHVHKGYVIVYAQYQDIANEIGMSIRTVGRNIQKLKANGEIQSKNRKIIITENEYKRLIKNLY